VFCFVEDVLGESTAGVEDFDADDAPVFPVECDPNPSTPSGVSACVVVRCAAPGSSPRWM
jgi:hypothetical protein